MSLRQSSQQKIPFNYKIYQNISLFKTKYVRCRKKKSNVLTQTRLLYQTRNIITNAPNKFMFGHAKGTPHFTQSTIQLNYNLYQHILYLYNKLQQI